MRILKYKRLIFGVLVVAAIVAVAMWPESMAVDITRVDHGPMQVTVDEDGETRVRDKFIVSAPVSGRLQRIDLEPGDSVTRTKSIVARLTPAESPLLDPRTRGELSAGVEAARAAVGQAQAERERAVAALDRARSTLRRQQELMKAGAIASDSLEAAETAVKSGEEALRAAEFTTTRTEYELQLARARLQAPSTAGRVVEGIAPVDGVILKRLRESESIVPAGEPLLVIGDPKNLEIVADLLSTDAVRIMPGARVLIEQWGGGHALEGHVRRIEPSGFTKVSALGVEEQRVNVIVDFNDAATASRVLGDGYRVEVRIVTWQESDVIKAPVGGIFRRGEGWAAFVVDQARAHLQTVEIGQRNQTDVQIAKGLSPGQTIVLHPPDTLMDNARVTIRNGDAGR